MVPLGIFQTLLGVKWYRNLLLSSATTDFITPAPVTQHDAFALPSSNMRLLEDFSREVLDLFAAPCNVRRMLEMSTRMRLSFHEKLQSSPACMLPSFCHTLPSGQETGTFVALDVGGSTFRVALVQLTTRIGQEKPVQIKRMAVSKIDETIRKLPSTEFFDWMAGRIRVMLEEDSDTPYSKDVSVPLGLAWSFPIEQTSLRGGRVQGMGKGFACQPIGQDLGELIEAACERAGVRVRVEAVINDSSAVLLSQAYANPATSMGLIMGTGTNAAAFLPVMSMGREKFGIRDPTWFSRAESVITNTELSMFGKDILPENRWDNMLNQNHTLPDFQPLEYMTTGRYLGELLRLIIEEAVRTCDFLNGKLPGTLQERYSLDTALLAAIESDASPNLAYSAGIVQTAFELSSAPTKYDMAFLRVVVEAISHRAAAYLSVAIHALWALQKETEINLTTPAGTPKTSIACNGSVILKYPGFKSRVEGYLEKLVSLGSGGGIFPVEQIALQEADEATIVGAAVAVAMADAEGP